MKIKTYISLICCVFVFCLSSFAAPQTWTGGGTDNLASNPDNWGGAVPSAVDDIVLNNTSGKHVTWNAGVGGLPDTVASWTQTADYTGTVTIATVYPGQGAFTMFTVVGNCVISNGVWTHEFNPTAVTNINNERFRLQVTVGNDLLLGNLGEINVDEAGYQTGRGPGGTYGASGSHGGHGWGGGPTYGSILAPTNLGSGGRSTSSANPFGGGAVRMLVRGTIRNSGLITANGGGDQYGAGAGGSIWLNAGALTGSGEICANGGLPITDPTRDAAGGRIALIVTNAGADFTSYTGTYSVFSGNAVSNKSRAAAGTIYLETASDLPGNGELVVNNAGGQRGYATQNTDLNGLHPVMYEFSRITLANGACISINSNALLNVSNTVFNIEGSSNSIWISGGTLLTSPVFGYSNFFIGVSAVGSSFSPSTSLTIGTNATLFADQPHVFDSDVIVAGGGNITHSSNTTAEVYKTDLTVNGDFTVQINGKVDVTAKGYTINNGPGASLSVSAGASHGGLGLNGGPCYGSIVAPTNIGSGGRGWSASIAGGGAVKLAVSGELRNDGVVRANAFDSNYRTCSGGSIYITAGTLSGAGAIEANSTTILAGDSPGGGGRIAIAVTNAGADPSTFAGIISAYGGRKSTVSGGAGTIYLRSAGQGLNEGTLIVDNDNMNCLGTEISSLVTDTTVRDVLMRRNGFLVLATNQTLAVGGVWSNAVTFTGYWGSAVMFAGGADSTSRIYGATTFMGLVCTNNSGKTLLFEENSTTAVDPDGRLIFTGSEISTNLVLRSISPGTRWKLNVDPFVEQVVWNVDVRDSDASGGAEIIAVNSINSGNNLNWRFITIVPGEINTWTGSSNTLWSMRNNWSLDRAPAETDFILIPGGCPHYPELDAARTVAGIEIQSGGALSLAGYDFTLTENSTIAGLLIASAAETITFMKNADFTGGSFTPALSSVLISGSAAQIFNPGSNNFYKINVLNSAGTVGFTDGMTAHELLCEAPAGTRSLRFAVGSIFNLKNLVMLGSSATTNITLRSSSSGSEWSLNVSGYRSVRGVDVQDSNANGGLPVPASDSHDGGGNSNWLFDASYSTWLGTSGNNFHLADNWHPAAVPDQNTRVLMDSINPMVITGAVTLLDLTVGGSANMATATVNSTLTVLENIMVLTNGTLVLNRPGTVNNMLYIADGGILTHSANASAEINKIDITVHGNVEIESGGVVNTDGKGYAQGQGPGTGTAASHGGRGSNGYSGGIPSAGPCYGSIIAPTNLGSGGGGIPPSEGGGVIIFRVAGAIRHDGLMCADGLQSSYNTGAGGSIFITAGELKGMGSINARGGNITGHSMGGGGRVSLVVTNSGSDFSGFTGQIKACSGSVLPGLTSAAGGAAGTIYMQTASETPSRGAVYVGNNNLLLTGVTDVPPSAPNVPKEADWAVFRISDGATLRLTNDFTVGDIYLDTANATLDLGGNILYVNSLPHKLGDGTVLNYGEIRWLQGVLIRFW